MMRVLLVSTNTCQDPYPVYPLGMSVVAGALRRAGHQVLLHDLSLEPSSEALKRVVADFDPECVGISVRNVDNVDSLSAAASWTGDDVRGCVTLLRTATMAPVVLGGPGSSLMPEELLNYCGADYGVAGPGEQAFPHLLAQLASGGRPSRLVQGEVGADALISPACWEIELLPDYIERGGLPGLHTKRGCPYGCVYCGYPLVEGTVVRHRPHADVLSDLREIRDRFGVREVFFTDAVFNDAQGKYLDLAEALAEAELGVRFGAYFKPAPMKEGEMRLLKRAGLMAVEAGTDGASDKTLHGLGKPHSMDDVFVFQECCANHALPCAHFVIFGGPGETQATLEEGLGNLERLNGGCVFAFLGLRVHKETKLHSLAVSEGCLRQDDPLIHPVFYHSPLLDANWAEQRLTEAFCRRRDRFFPPEEGFMRMRILRRMGYSGLLWNTLPVFSQYPGAR